MTESVSVDWLQRHDRERGEVAESQQSRQVAALIALACNGSALNSNGTPWSCILVLA